MMNLEEKKAQLQAQLDAVAFLEGLEPEVLAQVEKVFSNSTPSARATTTTAELVTCPVCGDEFKSSGLNRHITIAAKDHQPHADYKAAQ